MDGLTQRLVNTLEEVRQRIGAFDVFICLHIIEQALKDAEAHGIKPQIEKEKTQ